MNADQLRVAIVEALPEVHLAVAGLLENSDDLCIVGHARSLDELAAADPSDLDVLIADLRTCIAFPAALARLRERHPGMRLIVTTMNDGHEYEEAVTRLSAEAWVTKQDLGGRLVSVLRALGRPARRTPLD